MLRVCVLSAASIAAAATLSAGAPAAVAAAPDPATISVTGTGSASQAPDLAVLNVGVEARKDTAEAAEDAMVKAAGKVLDAIGDEGVEKKDVQTQGLSLRAVYDEKPGEPKIVGYEAGQSFTIKVRDIDSAGDVTQAVTDAGGDAARVHGISFDVADRDDLNADARADAYRDARAKARQYAKLSGHKLGRLISLKETGGGGAPQPVAMAAPEASDAKLEVPAGELTTDVSVSAEYALD